MARAVYALLTGLLTVLMVVACAGGVSKEAMRIRDGMVDAANAIDSAVLEAHVRELSSDAFAGRGPGTPEDVKTQTYLERELKRYGLRPGGENGAWRQPFTLISLTATQPRSWRFAGAAGELQLEQSKDFIVASGVQAERAEVSGAELVFVGYGIVAPEYDWDDYKGADLQGKVLVMLNNDPEESEDLFGGETRQYYGRWTYKYESAARVGAAGAIIVHTDHSAGYPWQVVQTSWSGAQFELPHAGEPVLQLKAWLTRAATDKLMNLAGASLDELSAAARQREFQPVHLGVTTSLALDVARKTTRSANVLGLLPGSDRDLADEVVIYTAHHDHLGVAEESQLADTIYNGAMDNATGVASVLSIAKALAEAPRGPRRSVLFAFVGAEEQGLLGSKYYARHPTFAPGRIAAVINLDGGQIAGRSRDVSFIGNSRSSIDDVARVVADFQDRVIVGDQDPSAGYYYRSDQFSLARVGVPGLFYRGGTDLLDGGIERGKALREAYIARNYHQPSDEVTADWRFDGLAEDARFGLLAGWLMADAREMQQWYAGDEFEAARMRAIAEVGGG